MGSWRLKRSVIRVNIPLLLSVLPVYTLRKLSWLYYNDRSIEIALVEYYCVSQYLSRRLIPVQIHRSTGIELQSQQKYYGWSVSESA